MSPPPSSTSTSAPPHAPQASPNALVQGQKPSNQQSANATHGTNNRFSRPPQRSPAKSAAESTLFKFSHDHAAGIIKVVAPPPPITDNNIDNIDNNNNSGNITGGDESKSSTGSAANYNSDSTLGQKRRSSRARAISVEQSPPQMPPLMPPSTSSTTTTSITNKSRKRAKANSVSSDISSQTSSNDPSLNNNNNSRRSFICESCACKSRAGASVLVNHHLHNNPFYSPCAVYSTLRVGSPYLAGPNAAVWNPLTAYETVSARPTTAAIPKEKVRLCEVCSALFMSHRLKCDTCKYVPRLDEWMMRDCMRCFEGVVNRH